MHARGKLCVILHRDDVLLLPGYSDVMPRDVSLQTRLTRAIRLNIPLVSAAMDTVTEARLAIALAQEGGIGIIHKSMGIEQQAAEVRAVKKFESGVVKDAITTRIAIRIQRAFMAVPPPVPWRRA